MGRARALRGLVLVPRYHAPFMDPNTNAWNRRRYSWWAPVYDLVGWHFDARRRRSLALLGLCPGERVLLVGERFETSAGIRARCFAHATISLMIPAL